MTLKTLVRLTRVVDQQSRVIQSQNTLIAELQQEIRRIHLEYNRDTRGLVCAWLINLERPELDMRHDLADLDTALANRVAELEEHVL